MMPLPEMPPWPTIPVAHGPVVLRAFADADVPMVEELATDPYVPTIGSLPANANHQDALDWIERQRGRLAEGLGFSFAIAEAGTDRAVGGIGLWLTAVTSFAWTIPDLHRIELYIEPWNTGSVGTAERAGYQREGLLRSHQEIGGARRDMLLYAIIRGERDA